MTEKPLKIIRASAGSGKTSRLVLEFLKLNLQRPSQIKDTLLITFTKAAAAEIKAKILAALKELVSPEAVDTHIFKELCSAGWDRISLQKQSRILLEHALLHFDELKAMTIDSLLWGIAMAGARELKIPHNAEVIISEDDIHRKALEDFLKHLHRNKDLMAFLQSRVFANGKFKSLEKEIDSAKNMMPFFELSSLEELNQICKVSNEVTKTTIDEFTEIYQRFQAECEQHMLDQDCFSNKGQGGLYRVMNDWAQSLANQTDKFPIYKLSGMAVHKDTKKKLPAVEEIAQIFAEFSNRSAHLFKVDGILKQFKSSLKLAAAIHQSKIAYAQNNLILSLKELNLLLQRKAEAGELTSLLALAGQQYGHIFIDEFQDTNRAQFAVLSEMIQECLSTGKKCFLVGDPKQMIFRFSSADSQIFSKAKTLFESFETEEFIQHNYRSQREIVEFNNAFVDGMLKSAQEKPELDFSLISANYQKHHQLPHKNGTGSPAVKIISANAEIKKYEDGYPPLFIKLAAEIKKQCNFGETVVLAANNNQLTMIGAYLIQQGIPVTFRAGEDLMDEPIVRFVSLALEAVENGAGNFERTELEKIFAIHLAEAEDDEKNAGNIVSEFLQKAPIVRYKSPAHIIGWVCECFKIDPLNKRDLLAYLDQILEWESKNSPRLSAWNAESKNLKMVFKPEGGLKSVRLSTIHGAKGLQWKNVHYWASGRCKSSKEWTVLSANGSQIPYLVGLSEPMKNISPGINELKTLQWLDQRNLMYVALTRAQETLTIYHCKSKNAPSVDQNFMLALAGIESNLYLEEEVGKLEQVAAA